LSGVGEKFETILQNADNALYAAKEAGRNCVRFHPPERLVTGVSN